MSNPGPDTIQSAAEGTDDHHGDGVDRVFVITLTMLMLALIIGGVSAAGWLREREYTRVENALSEKYGVTVTGPQAHRRPGEPQTWTVDGVALTCTLNDERDALRCADAPVQSVDTFTEVQARP